MTKKEKAMTTEDHPSRFLETFYLQYDTVWGEILFTDSYTKSYFRREEDSTVSRCSSTSKTLVLVLRVGVLRCTQTQVEKTSTST